MLNKEVLQKLDRTTLGSISAAQLDELMERRQVRDPDLFLACFSEAMYIAALTVEGPDGKQSDLVAGITDFSDLASQAFTLYHYFRKHGGYADKNGRPTIDPAPADEGQATEAPDCEDQEPTGVDAPAEADTETPIGEDDPQ